MLTISIAVHGLRERRALSDAPKEQIGCIAPDLSTARKEPGVLDPGELEVQGMAQPEVMQEGDLVGEDAQRTAQSSGSGGECRCPCGLPPF